MILFQKLKVLYEDNHIIAVNKPSGVLVHEASDDSQTLEDMVKIYIKNKYNKPGDVYLGTLHRIDRPTSGIVIFARTSKAAARMSTLFSTGQIKKYYLAITDDRPEPFSGTLIHFLIKNPENNTVKVHNNEKPGAKKAITHYEMLGQVDNTVMINVEIETGRPHQIRAQFKKLGVPINGDLKYGSEVVYSDQSIALHCRKMAFMHPVKQEPIEIIADVPDNMVWKKFLPLLKQENK